MTKYKGTTILLLLMFLPLGATRAQLGGRPGVLDQMGFGARGMGMGNAMTAVTTGDLIGYYNPAVLPFAEYRYVSASFGVLSLDRQLNFLGYAQAIRPNAGISAGLINAGVSKIDGRDNNGEPTGPLRTSENVLFLSFGLRPQGKFSMGVTAKLLYYHLYTTVTSATIGIDVGALLPIGQSLTIGAAVRDLLSKYKWDTGELYGSLRGTSTEEKFPTLFDVGASYRLPDSLGVIDVDVESSNQSTLIARAGAELALSHAFAVRAGIDRIDLKEKGNGIRPAFGLTLRQDISSFLLALNYAVVIEPFSPTPMQIVSVSVVF